MLDIRAFGLRAACALALPPLLLGAAPSHDALMDRIEASIVLPQWAGKLADYGRYYAFDGAGRVRAIYLVPPPRDEGGCAVITIGVGMRDCTRAERRASHRQSVALLASLLPAGKRRWYPSPRLLPGISDGGCIQVTVEFDVATGRFVTLACNGS